MTACSNENARLPVAPKTSAWTVQSSADPPGAATSSLLGVSCPSPVICIAVGYYTNGSNIEVTLAEHWNGKTWAIRPTPTPAGARSSGLTAVSCPSASACIAVGGYTAASGMGVPLAEHWNGTGWAIQPTPTPTGALSGALNAVSCPSATICTAVGGDTNSSGTGVTLAERWNGSGWAVQATPDTSGFSFNALSGVSCPSALACTAVGGGTRSTGTGVTLAERWDAGGWTIQATPNGSGGTGGDLSGVSCPSATACTAVGGYTNASGTGVTLAERRNGSRWAIQATPNPTGGTFSSLGTRGGVSCPSAGTCTAVGHYNRGQRVGLTVVELFKGRRWTVLPSPNVSGGIGGGLSGVSCPSAAACIAVGGYTSRSGRGLTLVELS